MSMGKIYKESPTVKHIGVIRLISIFVLVVIVAVAVACTT